MQLPDPAELDAWLAAREAEVPALRPHAAKRIDWAGQPGAVADIAVVYIHGFSASAQEISPVTERFASAIGANLHFGRMRGHGQDGAALGAARFDEWRADTAEALAIGAKIGRRVIAMGTSTGATLIADALGQGADLAGAAFIAPNFEIGTGRERWLLEAPLARHWLPWIIGRTRSFEPDSPAHGDIWTLSYPSQVVVSVAQAVRAARGLDYGRFTMPAFFAFAEEDKVVHPPATHRVMAKWGGVVTHKRVVMGSGDDPNAHNIAGDARSPPQNDGMLAALTAWAETL